MKKEIETLDGITVKVQDTDDKPLDADLAIVVGKLTSSPKDLPPHGGVKVRGKSGKVCKMTILWIRYGEDTVRFALDRMD